MSNVLETKSVLITGASGLIGGRLTKLLLARGHSVSHLSRSKKGGIVPTYAWDVDRSFIEPAALEGVGTIVHLAGAGIADKRWTPSRKKEILDSRIRSTALLREALQAHRVEAIISASAMGYYGPGDGNRIFTETDLPGTDFLASVTNRWEQEVDKFQIPGLRVVKFRIGVVLSDRGGALPSMARPVKWMAGAALGTGNQFVSWIHLDDLCNMFIKAIEDSNMHGVYNAVSSVPVTNSNLTKAIAGVLSRPLLLPRVPSAVLRILLGEMADIVLKGSKLSA